MKSIYGCQQGDEPLKYSVMAPVRLRGRSQYNCITRGTHRVRRRVLRQLTDSLMFHQIGQALLVNWL